MKLYFKKQKALRHRRTFSTVSESKDSRVVKKLQAFKIIAEISAIILTLSFFQKLKYLLRFFASLQNRVFNSSKVVLATSKTK